jgi:hypothetical protein
MMGRQSICASRVVCSCSPIAMTAPPAPLAADFPESNHSAQPQRCAAWKEWSTAMRMRVAATAGSRPLRPHAPRSGCGVQERQCPHPATSSGIFMTGAQCIGGVICLPRFCGSQSTKSRRVN